MFWGWIRCHLWDFFNERKHYRKAKAVDKKYREKFK